MIAIYPNSYMKLLMPMNYVIEGDKPFKMICGVPKEFE
jgi:hypothetical protein